MEEHAIEVDAMPAGSMLSQPGAEVTDELHADDHGVPVAQAVML
ncbi:MAG: hypothetical protein ACKO1K_04375 [Burkholderiales bacterium]